MNYLSRMIYVTHEDMWRMTILNMHHNVTHELLWRMVYVAHGHGHMLHNPPLEVTYVTYGRAIRDISHITHLERWVM